ncbi:ATP-dependent nuclease [Nonomuraea sp. NPDC003201]
MRLTSIEIENFRSVERAALDSCGALNVLIGKNNAGKSNLLVALHRFFDFFKDESAASPDLPYLTIDTEAYQRNTSVPGKIVARLTPSDKESQALRAKIADEAPQMRNALEEIPSDATIECELVLQQHPKEVAYISRIEFVSSDKTHNERRGTHLIYSVDIEAATDLATRVRDISRLLDDSRRLSTRHIIDPEEWRMSRDRERTSRLAARRFIARFETSSETTGQIEQLYYSASTYEEFVTSIRDLASSLEDQAARLREASSKSRIQTFAGETNSVPGYMQTLISMIARMKVHYLTESRSPIGEAEARRILDLKTSRGRSDMLGRIQALVESLLGVRIDAFTADRPVRSARSEPEIPAEIDVDDFLVQVNGSGIREALRVILDYEFERPNILLLEEPEVHLHPALESAMLQYLKSIGDHCQVFLTTHSTNFLDSPEFENVYMVTRAPSTSVQLIHVEEAEQALPSELGLRLSSLFMFDRLVFVEGPTDERVLRSLAAKADINLGKRNIGFIAIGGARNFGHYANSQILSFLSKRKVQIYFILDRDERSPEEIEGLRRRIGDLGKLWVLKQRELENYLINASTISRLLESRAGVQISAEDVEAVIENACEIHQSAALERAVLFQTFRPLTPDRDAVIKRGEVDFAPKVREEFERVKFEICRIEENLEAAIEQIKGDLLGTWDHDKRTRVPGDLVLETVFAHYGVKFKKQKDGLALAELMTREELPSEILDILRSIVA